MKKIIYAFALPLVFMFSCSTSEEPTDDTDDNNNNNGTVPGVATLVFPENNKLCTQGTIINDLENTITFQWQEASDTDSYEVNVSYVESGVTVKQTSTTTEATITLERGKSYSWFVVSKSNDTNDDTRSETWRFFNEGVGETHYAPFPALITQPVNGATISNTTSVNLQWNGSDADNDIVEYQVYLDTNETPSNSLGTTTQNSVNVTVQTGQTYYWKVKTIDAKNNTSESEVFNFSVE
ncbi:Ig-like domain-containing protein [Flavobacterium sp. ASW18X]|uniref:Ig-like domain-containing protein n=1 Tax=Flavobacterium sp. ASW18X TaxID=2572595 RepID=UPI0010AE0100|nr:Ig-like domain-containing protein [Flavobacterium sp. ASW18X]TKD66511.1 hypothetical protein FBT53_01245 [Flavobacterium sp. ASW18X]